MKHSIFTAFILLGIFSASNVFAASNYPNIKNIISKNCSGSFYVGNFSKGFNCSGAKKEIYYIKDTEVTKDVFNAKKSDYDTKGDICEKTENSKAYALPKGVSYSCVKGAYGNYSVNGKKVTFNEFTTAILGLALSEATKESNFKLQPQLKLDKKVLKSLKTFKEALLSPVNKYTFSSNYPIVGSACLSSGSVLFSGNGYKNLVCENGKVKSIDHYLNNNKVSSDVYLKAIYKTQLDATNAALDSLKNDKAPIKKGTN